ncbi:hypothetical protein ACROYT_G002212 [Oculina patagonica]
MSFFSQSRKLPSAPTSKESSPKPSPRGSPAISSRNSPRDGISQIPVKKTPGSPATKQKPAPLLRSRSREFMDAVKKFEGGKLPDKLLKTVDEERKAMEDHLSQSEKDLKEIREFVLRTQDDFQRIRGQTKKLRNNLSELHDLNRTALTRS